MQTFQITCVNIEPIVFEDIEEPDPMCLFEYKDGLNQNPAPLRQSLFQPFASYYGEEIALKTIKDVVYVYTLVDNEWKQTQWMVSAFMRFSVGYDDGVEYANSTLANRKNVDHDLFLNPNGLLPKLGVYNILEYAYIYGVLDTIKYNFHGLPSVLELQEIVSDTMRLFVSGIQFQANASTDTTLYDFLSIDDGTMEFQPSILQPLGGERDRNIIVTLSGHSLFLNNHVIIMYEGTSDYNYGVLRSRLLALDELESRILDVIKQPTLYRLGIAAGLAYRGKLLQGMPTISQLTEFIDQQDPDDIEFLGEQDNIPDQNW